MLVFINNLSTCHDGISQMTHELFLIRCAQLGCRFTCQLRRRGRLALGRQPLESRLLVLAVKNHAAQLLVILIHLLEIHEQFLNLCNGHFHELLEEQVSQLLLVAHGRQCCLARARAYFDRFKIAHHVINPGSNCSGRILYGWLIA